MLITVFSTSVDDINNYLYILHNINVLIFFFKALNSIVHHILHTKLHSFYCRLQMDSRYISIQSKCNDHYSKETHTGLH